MDAGRPAEALSAAHMALEIAQDLDSHKLQAGGGQRAEYRGQRGEGAGVFGALKQQSQTRYP